MNILYVDDYLKEKVSPFYLSTHLLEEQNVQLLKEVEELLTKQINNI
jgi:hypothetical protein